MTDPKPLPDEQSMAEALRYVDSYLGYRQGFDRIPGVQAAVHAFGSVQFSEAYGHADVENGTALTEQHLFRIASHSKTFTSTAIMQLADAGTLRLDDRAGRWVTALDGHPAGAVTVREMLGHVSGLTRDSTNGDFWQLDGRFPDRARLLEILLDDRSAVIGEQDRFKYSNIAYGLLGLVIESAAGASYAEAVRVGIVDRLGLDDLGPELDPDRCGRLRRGVQRIVLRPAPGADRARRHRGLGIGDRLLRHRKRSRAVFCRALPAATNDC